MNSDDEFDEQWFWSGDYRGREIAIFHCSGRWRVYLDKVLQHDKVFGTAEQATVWLLERVDRAAKERRFGAFVSNRAGIETQPRQHV